MPASNLRAVRRQLLLSSPAAKPPSECETDGEGEHDDHLGAFDPPPRPQPRAAAPGNAWAWPVKPPRPPARTPTSVLDVRLGSLSSLTPQSGERAAWTPATPAASALKEVPLLPSGGSATALVRSVRPEMHAGRGCAVFFASCAATAASPRLAASPSMQRLEAPPSARRSRMCSILG